MVRIEDVVVLSIASFLGNAGIALTGFGMAIIFFFFFQVATLFGYNCSFKYAVFIQSLALLCVQPMLVYKSNIRKYACRKTLLYFIPITIISTPLGLLVGGMISSYLLQAITGIIVTLLACYEINNRKDNIIRWLAQHCTKKKDNSNHIKNDRRKNQPTLLPTDPEDIDCRESSENVQCTSQENKKVKVNRVAVDVKSSALDTLMIGNTSVMSTIEKSKYLDLESLPQGIESAEENIDLKIIKEDIFNEDKETMCTDGSLESLSTTVIIWTLFAGGTSGFLGGICGVRGPPVLFYFLHPPYPLLFTKSSQRATAATMNLMSVTIRVLYYLVDSLLYNHAQRHQFEKSDWSLYLSIVICSILGVHTGCALFDRMKDSLNPVHNILTILLLLCGVSLTISSFAGLFG